MCKCTIIYILVGFDLLQFLGRFSPSFGHFLVRRIFKLLALVVMRSSFQQPLRFDYWYLKINDWAYCCICRWRETYSAEFMVKLLYKRECKFANFWDINTLVKIDDQCDEFKQGNMQVANSKSAMSTSFENL